MHRLALTAAACLFLTSPAWAQADTTYTVYFGLNQASLDAEARNTLAQAANTYTQTGTSRVDVTGYTDLSGSAATNERLSQQRAEAVRAELVRLGVPDSSIAVTAAGESDPAVQTADGVREAANRRVVVAMETPPAPEPAAPVPAPPPSDMRADSDMRRGTEFFGGELSIGALYGYNMEDSGDNDKSSHLGGLNVGFDYAVTDFMALSLEQAGFYNFYSEDDGWGGRSAAGLDFTLGVTDIVPHIGANIGYLYGSGIDDDWFAGPEVGLNIFGFDAKVAYDIPFNRDIQDGVIVATVGLGLRF